MGKTETKAVVIALLILGIGFFYTTLQDRFTGYTALQNWKDSAEQFSANEESSIIVQQEDVQFIEQPQEKQQPIFEDYTPAIPSSSLEGKQKFIDILRTQGAQKSCFVPEELKGIIIC